ncbi:MAG TPA: polysaccharide deacetylase family protein [Micromonosporaceae bacterium]|nr:polysaccharide deacetylase family protein [Micromonosporaceae bacterium]
MLGLPAGPVAQQAVAVSGNQAATSAVALAALGDGSNPAFYRGQDDAIYQRTLSAGWSAQTSLGGVAVGAPAVAATSATSLALAVRGTDSALWIRYYTGTSWGPWHSLGGVLSAAPAITSVSGGRLDLFVRGNDDRLYTRTLLPGAAWSPWTSLGGILTSGPGATAVDGRIEVNVIGTDRAIYRKVLSSGVWSSWASLGGRSYTAPAVVKAPRSTGVYVLVRGTDNRLYYNESSTGSFSGWRSVGGQLIDAPAATELMATMARGFHVVVRGTDNALWLNTMRDGEWSGFARAWVPAAPPPPAAGLLGTDWTRIPTTSRVIALTFDAGANANGLASIRTTLARKNVPATFFLTGSWVRTFPAQANEVVVGGFRVGNHTDTHPHLPALLDDAQVRAQLLNAQRSILLANGSEARPLFRFPYGDRNARTISIVNSLGYVPVRWTVDSLGWQGTSGGQTTQLVINRVLAGAQPGAIVLMHVGSNPDDGTTLDAAALPQIIDGLRARGYSFVTLKALTG